MDELDKNKIINYKKTNRKLFILYKILANDLLFYYTISYLFLANVKGLSTAQIVFAESFYPLFKLIFQIPCTILIQKIGKRNSLLIANFCVALYLFFVLNLTTTFVLILANVFCAIGFVIKGIAESNFLYDSLEETENIKEEFSKIEGKASSCFFFIDAITALATGFIYLFNPYLPIVLSLISMLLSLVITLKFHEIPNNKNQKQESVSAIIQIKSQLSDTYQGFKYIFKSSRLKALIFFNALSVSLLILMVTLHRSILDDLGVSSSYLGIIFALMGIVISFSSSRSVFLHKKYRNKTLSILGTLLVISIILTGLVTTLNFPKFLTYYLLLIMISITYIVKGPHYVLIKQYLNSFCDSNMRIKIYSANLLIEYISTSAISMSCSFLLNYYTNAFTTLIVGLVSAIAMIIIIKYMATRVGLKPEEYSKRDILFLELD